MIVIYDFDGTLTPYSLPQYEILKKCGIDDMQGLLLSYIQEHSVDLYTAYCRLFEEILHEHGYMFCKDIICLGVCDIAFHNGVLSYFQNMQFEKTGIKHYVLTSGFEEYIQETLIAPYLDGIYGTTFHVENDEYTKIERLMTDQRKIDYIRHFQEINQVPMSEIVYVGDGLTDQYAFSYVHEHGGTSIFLASSLEDNPVYKTLQELDILDECFVPDFSPSSPFYHYISNLQK